MQCKPKLIGCSGMTRIIKECNGTSEVSRFLALGDWRNGTNILLALCSVVSSWCADEIEVSVFTKGRF